MNLNRIKRVFDAAGLPKSKPNKRNAQQWIDWFESHAGDDNVYYEGFTEGGVWYIESGKFAGVYYAVVEPTREGLEDVEGLTADEIEFHKYDRSAEYFYDNIYDIDNDILVSTDSDGFTTHVGFNKNLSQDSDDIEIECNSLREAAESILKIASRYKNVDSWWYDRYYYIHVGDKTYKLVLTSTYEYEGDKKIRAIEFRLRNTDYNSVLAFNQYGQVLKYLPTVEQLEKILNNDEYKWYEVIKEDGTIKRFSSDTKYYDFLEKNNLPNDYKTFFELIANQ